MKRFAALALFLLAAPLLAATGALGVENEGNVVMHGNLRVVIDPAQGGMSEGSHGINAMKEKDVTLSFARVLASRLEAAGFEPRLTREGDRDLTAEERASFANRVSPALLVSLGVNGGEVKGALGVEVFYAPAPPQSANPEGWRAGQFYSQAKSRELANALLEGLTRTAGYKSRGARELESPLLASVTAPAVIVTLGNISSAEEADLLLTDAGKKKVAEALTKVIADFVEKYRK